MKKTEKLGNDHETGRSYKSTRKHQSLQQAHGLNSFLDHDEVSLPPLPLGQNTQSDTASMFMSPSLN